MPTVPKTISETPGQREAADPVAQFERIVEQEPSNVSALHALGVLHRERGDFARAVALIGRAVALQPTAPALHINLAEAYRNLGDSRRAAGCCTMALRLAPDYPEGLCTLGLVLQDMGRLAEAADHFPRTLELRADFAAAHNNLGWVLKLLGQRDEAIVHFRRAVECDAGLNKARTNLGLALLEKGEAEEALVHFQMAVRAEPDEAILHHNLGNALSALQQRVEATAAYLEALRLDPDLALAHLQIGMALRRDGQLEAALPWHRQAIALVSNNAHFWEQLAELHAEREDAEEAIACWEKVQALSPAPRAATYLGLGRALQDAGRATEARESFLAAARLQPTLAVAQLSLGGIQEELGEMDQAEAAYRTALELQPNFALPHARLATLLRHNLPDPDLAALEKRLEDPELPGGPRARLLFGLAHALDARGDYARAADCLRQANRLTLEQARPAHAYAPDEHRGFVESLLRVFDRSYFARTARAGMESCRPVFIFGLPRSGTTLLEQVLSSHPLIHGAGELRLGRQSFQAIPSALGRSEPPLECAPSLDAAALGRLAEQHLEKLAALDRGRHERIIDKMPDNFMYLGLLATMFPRATFIHCRRDVRDVALSCWMTDFRSIRWANDPEQIADRVRQYLRLMRHWRAVVPAPIHEVDYEETVTDLEGVARRLLWACGMEWDPACLAFHKTPRLVRTASVAQVRQAVYKTSVSRWKHYADHVADLFLALPVGPFEPEEQQITTGQTSSEPQ